MVLEGLRCPAEAPMLLSLLSPAIAARGKARLTDKLQLPHVLPLDKLAR